MYEALCLVWDLLAARGYELMTPTKCWNLFRCSFLLILFRCGVLFCRGYIQVNLSLPSIHFRRLPRELQEGRLVKVIPVLFTQGINEHATLAERYGNWRNLSFCIYAVTSSSRLIKNVGRTLLEREKYFFCHDRLHCDMTWVAFRIPYFEHILVDLIAIVK